MSFLALGFYEILYLRSLFQIFFMSKTLSQVSCEVDSGYIHGAENRNLPGVILHFFLPAHLADMLGGKAFPSTVCYKFVAPKD